MYWLRRFHLTKTYGIISRKAKIVLHQQFKVNILYRRAISIAVCVQFNPKYSCVASAATPPRLRCIYAVVCVAGLVYRSGSTAFCEAALPAPHRSPFSAPLAFAGLTSRSKQRADAHARRDRGEKRF